MFDDDLGQHNQNHGLRKHTVDRISKILNDLGQHRLDKEIVK
jgi:hypothetical protein